MDKVRKRKTITDFFEGIQPKKSLVSEMESQDTQTVQNLDPSLQAIRLQEMQTAQPQCRTQVSTSTTHCVHPAQGESTASHLLTSTDQILRHFSRQQLEAWTQQYSPWLFINGNKLGCTFCRDAKRLFGTQKGVQVSEEWASGEVSAKDVRSMRKKIYKHKDSITHKKATEINQLREKEVLTTLTETINAKVLSETEHSFRTAYFVAKEKLAFSKMNGLVELQEMNGVKTGSCHKSDHSCINIIAHIASKMKKKIVSTIKSVCSWIGLTVDESTVFGISYLILYLRGDVTVEGEIENIFLDLIELEEGTTADAIYKAVKKSLMEADLDDEYLKSHLICITTDGASVMTGRESGLITRLKKEYSLMESIHCLAHRLELSVNDALKSVTGCNYFEIFISKLYTLYHQSPKNARQLAEAASQVNVSLLKIGKIFTIRWVASSFVTVQAVWRDYPALAEQMKKAAEDGSRCDGERKKFNGLLNRLTATGFVKDLAAIKDVLRELRSLSLKLQKRNISLMDATQEIKMTIEVLKALKTTPGKSMDKAEESLQSGEFKGVPLHFSKEHINRQQFLQALIDSLSSRMPDTKLTKIVAPLNPVNWPKSREFLVLFGEKEIHDLAKMLGVSSREAVEDFRNWKLNNDQNGKVLKKLLTASKTYLASSAECERGFSALNATATDARNRLRVRSLSAVLFIDLNGPPLNMFDPQLYIQSWLREKHCLSTASKTGRDKSAPKIRPLWAILSSGK